jgi:hypothetical protein
MAKGIPLMGRGPDGKAKIINVDENGNVKVQQSGKFAEVNHSLSASVPDRYYYAGDEVAYSGSGAIKYPTPFEIRDFSKVFITIKNNSNASTGSTAIGKVNIAFFNSKGDLVELLPVDSLPAQASMRIVLSEFIGEVDEDILCFSKRGASGLAVRWYMGTVPIGDFKVRISGSDRW